MKIDYKRLLFYIIITLFIGGIPSIFVYTNNIYDKLNKPPLSPPGILFPIVWTILFILMGISIYRVSKYKSNYFNPNIIYFVQLIVNALWTPLFFGLNLYLISAIWIVILIILVIYMIISYYKYDSISGYLLIPYIIWLLFALYLNIGIYILN